MKRKIIKYNVQSEEKNIKVVITADKRKKRLELNQRLNFF